MKRTAVFSLIILSFVLTLGVTGCRKKQTGTTIIPGRTGGDRGAGGGANSSDTAGTLNQDFPTGTDITEGGGIPVGGKRNEGGPTDREILQAEMIHFDLDSATIKNSEKPKLDRVADYIKANGKDDVLIEGHCDERGTEGYNLSLGERRALAAREYLAGKGVNVSFVYTLSYGESRPIEPLGTGEGAYSKNRRCEFVVVKPAQ